MFVKEQAKSPTRTCRLTCVSPQEWILRRPTTTILDPTRRKAAWAFIGLAANSQNRVLRKRQIFVVGGRGEVESQAQTKPRSEAERIVLTPSPKATADKSGGSRVSCGPRLAREGLEEVKKEGVGGGLKIEVRI